MIICRAERVAWPAGAAEEIEATTRLPDAEGTACGVASPSNRGSIVQFHGTSPGIPRPRRATADSQAMVWRRTSDADIAAVVIGAAAVERPEAVAATANRSNRQRVTAGRQSHVGPCRQGDIVS